MQPVSRGAVPGYVAAPLPGLRTLATAAVDLFVRYEPGRPPVLYCAAGWPLEPEQFDKLQAAGIEELLVRHGDFDNFSGELLHSLDSLLQQESAPLDQKYALLQLAVGAEAENVLRAIDCNRYFASAERIAGNLCELLAGSDVLPSDLYRMARHDFSTFTHLTNVASYSVLLAERLGVADRDDLRRIALGAMLHDVGKHFVPPAILSKPGSLTLRERAIVEDHPRRGYVELRQRRDLTFGQLMMVYQHHEHVDGSGYPVGVVGDEIHPWARLLAVVDVFDALTGARPYRQSLSRREALDYQRERIGTHFDPEIMQCWLAAMTVA